MAESLKELYIRHTWAESVFVYGRAVDNMRDPTVAEYNKLPISIKNLYPNYEAYRDKIRADNVVTKAAIKTKLNLADAEIDGSGFKNDEKTQYKKETKDVKDKCDAARSK